MKEHGASEEEIAEKEKELKALDDIEEHSPYDLKVLFNENEEELRRRYLAGDIVLASYTAGRKFKADIPKHI